MMKGFPIRDEWLGSITTCLRVTQLNKHRVQNNEKVVNVAVTH